MNPDLIKQLLALASLREQAERDARETQNLGMEIPGVRSDAWDDLDQIQRQSKTRVQAALLADLTRWQSQAWALRRIAEILGWNCGSETPRIFRFEDGFLDVLWRIGIGPDQSYTQVLGLPDSPFAIFCQSLHFPRAQKRHEVAGIATMDRPNALAAILLHLEANNVS